MWRRTIAGLIGLVTLGNGASMLADGAGWYARVPGVTDTGPFNPHFVADIGLAFVVAGGALLARAWRPALWPAGMAGAAFLIAHAGLHLLGLGESHHAAFEIALVFVPALTALWATWPEKST